MLHIPRYRVSLQQFTSLVSTSGKTAEDFCWLFFFFSEPSTVCRGLYYPLLYRVYYNEIIGNPMKQPAS